MKMSELQATLSNIYEPHEHNTQKINQTHQDKHEYALFVIN